MESPTRTKDISSSGTATDSATDSDSKMCSLNSMSPKTFVTSGGASFIKLSCSAASTPPLPTSRTVAQEIGDVKNPRIEKVNIALEKQQLVKRLENDNVHKGTHHEDGQIITEQVTEVEAEAEAVESPTNQMVGELNPETVESQNKMGNLENGEVQRKEYLDPKLEVTDDANGDGTSRNLWSSTLLSNVALGTCNADESNAPVIIDGPTSSPQLSVETNENMLPLDESVSDINIIHKLPHVDIILSFWYQGIHST